MERNYNKEVGQFFGDRFSQTPTKARFEVMLDHFEKKFGITNEQVKEAYEKTYALHQEGKVDKFPGYFAALCKSVSNKEYTPEQTKRHIEYNVKQREDHHLEDFISKYEQGERRVFAPSFGISKKEHSDIAYEVAKAELKTRLQQRELSRKEMARVI